MSKRFIAVALLLFAAACTSPIQLVEPPNRIIINKTYSVAPSVPWTSYSTVSNVTWTIDGPGLQSLVFVDGVKDGGPLFAKRRKKNMPEYRKGMTPIEIKDLFISTLGRYNYHQLKVRKMRPTMVGDARGFRFNFSGTTKAGLRKRGFAVGAVRNDMLYLVYYWGTELHYYDKHRRDAERIVASLKFVKA
jgi:hypothetical protein